jgi:hypothetical protein
MTGIEKDVNATIKRLLEIVEAAAAAEPVVACEPYACEDRRRLVIKTVWGLYKRCSQREVRRDARASIEA